MDNVIPFVLYGLVGCPHCVEAEKFLRSRGLPTQLIVANEDPVADAGAKANNRQHPGTAEYPILVSKLTKEIKVGYVLEDYERIANAFFTIVSSSAPSLFGGEQQSVPQAPVQTEATSVN